MSRKAKGLLALAIIIGLVCVGAAIFFFVESLMRSSDVYRQAMSETRNSSRVATLLGNPVEESGFVTGRLRTNGDHGFARLVIGIAGPRGHAHLHVYAQRVDDAWEFKTLRITKDGTSEAVDLVAPADTSPN